MALNLLQNYGSDCSSDEEVKVEKVACGESKYIIASATCDGNGDSEGDYRRICKSTVQISTEEESKLCKAEKVDDNKQTQSLLPLPSVLKEMFRNKVNYSEELENSSLHEGRVRSFPHVRGNWASFVNISVNRHEAVDQQIEILMKTLEDFPDSGIQLCSDFHLSLTKTLVFRHHWIDSFISSMKEYLCRCDRFHIVFDEFKVYVNDEKTRTFVGMKVNSCTQLLTMIRFCDKTLADYDLEPYYENPSFHISIAWILGDHSAWLKKSVLSVLNSKWRKACEEDYELQVVLVKGIQFKTGNKVYEFPLKSP